ncbi:hypothetical protein J2Y56_003480 [Pseudomonas sp. BE134]|nr:hypothetical protein [Pseudomonas sp. BE134]
MLGAQVSRRKGETAIRRYRGMDMYTCKRMVGYQAAIAAPRQARPPLFDMPAQSIPPPNCGYK